MNYIVGKNSYKIRCLGEFKIVVFLSPILGQFQLLTCKCRKTSMLISCGSMSMHRTMSKCIHLRSDLILIRSYQK